METEFFWPGRAVPRPVLVETDAGQGGEKSPTRRGMFKNTINKISESLAV